MKKHDIDFEIKTNHCCFGVVGCSRKVGGRVGDELQSQRKYVLMDGSEIDCVHGTKLSEWERYGFLSGFNTTGLQKKWLIRFYTGGEVEKKTIFSHVLFLWCQWTFNSFVNWFEHMEFDKETKSTDWGKWLFLCAIFITICGPRTTVIYFCFVKLMRNFLIKIGAEDVYSNNKWIK